MWWRNLALVIAMVVFGLWHKASVLFLLWGCYHGILLVLHRQVQQAQRRFDWNPPAKSWLPVSWIATMALINLGWIFFRASSLPQARQMIGAIVSPMNYNSHVLSASLYFLVAVVAIGYAIVLLIADALARYSNEVQTSEANFNPGMFGLMARWRWFWIPPLYALALIFLLLVTLTQGASTAQFMYNKF
jgi:alginate O-acetyltransferase complex protein AlgI